VKLGRGLEGCLSSAQTTAGAQIHKWNRERPFKHLRSPHILLISPPDLSLVGVDLRDLVKRTKFNPLRPHQGHPIILGSGSRHTAQYIRLGWLMSRGSSDHHHHSKKDSIFLCESNMMHHYPCAKPSSSTSCSFHYAGTAFRSCATASPTVHASSP
jgi:hypothetical protein